MTRRRHIENIAIRRTVTPLAASLLRDGGLLVVVTIVGEWHVTNTLLLDTRINGCQHIMNFVATTTRHTRWLYRYGVMRASGIIWQHVTLLLRITTVGLRHRRLTYLASRWRRNTEWRLRLTLFGWHGRRIMVIVLRSGYCHCRQWFVCWLFATASLPSMASDCHTSRLIR